jgi:hypothetical protein
MTNSKEIKLEDYEACWVDLAQHLLRDAIIILNGNLDILKIAQSIAKDESETVNKWISQGVINKPTAEQIKQWNRTPDKLFQCVIVQPYVIIKELLVH